MAQHNESLGPGSPGSGLPGADSSVSEGTDGNESGENMENELRGALKIKVPIDPANTQCAECSRQGRQRGFVNLRDLDNHMKRDHPRVAVIYVCQSCKRNCPSKHSWDCHRPKCSGPPPPAAAGQFQCTHCDRTFSTQIGLSQHERHEHPRVRNEQRQAQANRPRRVNVRPNPLWSEEETALLITLDRRFRNSRYPNVEIQAYLPNKTYRQIGEKRRRIPRDAPEPEPESESDTESGEVSSSTSSEEGEYHDAEEADEHQDPAHEETIRDGEDPSQTTWETAMDEHILAIELSRNNKYRESLDRLKEIWQAHKAGPQLVEHIDAFVRELSSTLMGDKRQPDRTQRANNERSTRRVGRQNRRQPTANQRRKFRYARCQELYRKCPKRLAEIALSGDFTFAEVRKDPPPVGAIRGLYEQLWGGAGPEINELIQDESRETARQINEVFPPIKVEEVTARICRIKSKSAAGLDGIKKGHITPKGVAELLTALFNILVRHTIFPKEWNNNRTTLIPKDGKNHDDIKNWRPITVGSLLGRTYTGLVDQRLRGFVKQSIRQKGFTAEDGCRSNTLILEKAIEVMKGLQGGIVVVADVSKAFDTVPHSAIKLALERKGVPRHIVKLIEEMYAECVTSIKGPAGQSVVIKLERGVKQGDPLSPLLFNLIMDPIINKIDEDGNGVTIGESDLAILAFADDIVVLGKDQRAAQAKVGELDNYMRKLGMSLSVPKCSAFEIISGNKTWFARNPNLHIRGEEIPGVEADEVFNYLGTRFGPWTGLQRGKEIPKIADAIRNVRSLSLKPYQKVDVIATYILPHFMYELTASPPAAGTLEALDNSIRVQIKEILKLPLSTAKGFFYTPKKDGGLGLVRVARAVQLLTIKSGITTAESEDQILREINRNNKFQKRVERSSEALRTTRPTNKAEYQRIKGITKEREREAWKSLRSQGQGVEDFRGDKYGNCWLKDPRLLKSSRYTDAIRMRTNTFGTRVVLSRTTANAPTICRRCNLQPETLGHVIGQCVFTKPARIRRHDQIKELIADRVSKNHTVMLEPTINEGGELKKPDMVIKMNDEVLVVDVTVRYEKGAYLAEAEKEKKRKYQGVAKLMAQRLGTTKSQVIPIVIGSRGAITRRTVNALDKLGINRKDKLTIALMTLRSSIEIANAFIDY